MLCPNCGIENAEGAAFCASCGSAMNAATPLQDVPQAAPVEETNPVPETEETCKKCPLKSLWEKIRPGFERYKLFIVGALGVLALILSIGILVALCSRNGFMPIRYTIQADVRDGEVFIITDTKKAKATGLEAKKIVNSLSSMDGSVLVLMTEAGDLAVVKGNKLTHVASNAVSFKLSEDGTGIAYIAKEEDANVLFLYNVKNKKTKAISSNITRSNYFLSPDGDSVVYYEMKEEDLEAKVMLFRGKKSSKVTSGEVNILGLSDNGKYIYGYMRNEEYETVLYRYNRRGNRVRLGLYSGGNVYFNADHTQILFTNDGKSYISNNGREAVKIASNPASVLLPQGSALFRCYSDSATVPTDDLFGKVYSCDGDLWVIRRNPDRSVKLANNVSFVTLSRNAKRVYYTAKGQLKVLKVRHGDNAADKARLLCDEQISSYVVTSDCRKVYYVCDGSLFAVNGKTGRGRKTIAYDEVSGSLAINGRNVVYYLVDGDCYATKGGKGKLVLSDAEYMAEQPNGIVYILTEDTVYGTKGPKKPVKIFSLE